MSKLYGKLTPDWKEHSVTRTAHHVIETWVQTEKGRITVELSDNGMYTVYLDEIAAYHPSGPGKRVLQGNVNTGEIIHE